MRLDGDWYHGPLPDGVELADGCWVYSAYAFMHCSGRARIGRSSGVYFGCSFDLGPDGEVVIGEFSQIVMANFATNHRVVIGDHALVAHYVVFADRPVAVPSPAGGGCGDIVIGDNVWIGMRSMILGGARIGDDAIIGARTVVDFEVPPGAIVAGNPARVVGHASEGRHRYDPPVGVL